VTTRPKIPSPYDIPQDQIEEVARDLRWEMGGCKVYLAVDSKDIIDYCFPLNPFAVSSPDLEKISSEQTALDFMFRRREWQPLLLSQYVEDLEHHISRVQNSVSHAYEDLQMWNCMRWGLSVSEGRATEEATEEQFASLKNNIVRKLAVWLGIDSLGLERFRNLLQNGLHSIRQVCEENGDDPDLQRIVKEYEPRRVKEIAAFLESQIPERTEEHKRKTRENASLRDANAIDWLLHLNHQCSELRTESQKAPRYAFLYVSSAPKTASLFQYLLGQDWYPLRQNGGGGTPYSFHRNRNQILLVARAGWGANGGAATASANLDQIALIGGMIAEAAQGLHNACRTCILGGGHGEPDCGWSKVCDAIKRVELKTSDVPNLGLLSRLKQYDQLLKARPRLKDKELCLSELAGILQNGTIPDQALQRVIGQQLFATTQSLLARWVTGVNASQPTTPLPDPLFSLPIIFPELPRPYNGLQAMVARYCSLDLKQIDEKREIVLRAMHEFQELDEGRAYSFKREHELARLLLHLAFGGEGGHVDVLERSRQLREKEEVCKEPYPFVLCSLIASLQLDRYMDTSRYVSEAMELRPMEAFLYHARGVNTFSWLRHRDQSVFCARDVTTCIDDERSALEMLDQQQNDAERTKNLRGLILNNLTFMHSYSTKDDFKSIFDLEQAQLFFERLLQVIPRNLWGLTPRYFHTEAYMEYQLACASPAEHGGHLSKANMAIERAVHFRPHEKIYVRLLEQITTAISNPTHLEAL
jgi:hypothetical protein